MKRIIANEPYFFDVPRSHWASGYVEAGVARGLISGYSDGKERDTFTMTFSLPAGARETVEQYIQQTENAKTELATAIINRVKGVI